MLVDGWVDWAIRHPGPDTKQYAVQNAFHGIVCHSMEGWLAGSLAELEKLSRNASWHFSIALDGTLYQHYPITASCWASGNYIANTTYVAVECEGRGVDGPLTELQIITMQNLLRELNFTIPGVDIFQHNEVATRWSPNAGPTACPSNRYDELFELLRDDMSPEERETFNALVTIFGGREKVLEAAKGGMNYLLGYAIEQQEQNELEVAIKNLKDIGTGSVPDHNHKTTVQTITTGGVVR